MTLAQDGQRDAASLPPTPDRRQTPQPAPTALHSELCPSCWLGMLTLLSHCEKEEGVRERNQRETESGTCWGVPSDLDYCDSDQSAESGDGLLAMEGSWGAHSPACPSI